MTTPTKRLGVLMAICLSLAVLPPGAVSASVFPPSDLMRGRQPVQDVQYQGPYASGNIAYYLGGFTSGVCHMTCSILLSTSLVPTFDQAEIFLTGWHAEHLGGLTPMHRLEFGAVALGYDSATGQFDWEARADIRSAPFAGDEYQFQLFFAIVLTVSAGAQLVSLQPQCMAPAGGTCMSHLSVPNLVPSGWEVAAVAVKRFRIDAIAGNSAGGVLLQRVAMNVGGWTVSGSTLDVPLTCAMHDSLRREHVVCEVEAFAIIAEAGETAHARFNSADSSSVFFHQSGFERALNPVVDGGFGGLDGFALSFAPGEEASTWAWAGNYNDILICPNRRDFCYHGYGFIGDRFGMHVNTRTFDIELSGFVVWTRP
jgi:hypothetical protein